MRSLLLAFLFFSWAQQSSAQSPQDKLLELAVRPPSVAYSGKKLVVSWYGNHSQAREVRVFYKPPNLWRHEVIDPSGKIIKTTIQNGQREWIFREGYDVILERDIKQIRHGELNKSALKELLSINFSIQDAGQRNYIGTPARGIILTPNTDAGSRRSLWVDPKTGIILHRRQSNHRGKSIQESRMTFLEIKKDLPAELFLPPANEKTIVQESQREKIDTRTDLAKYAISADRWKEKLPLGYRLDTVRALPISEESVVHFRYSNGLSILSVFISPYEIDTSDFSTIIDEEDDADAEFAAVSWAGNFLSWKDKKHYFLIVGDLGTKRLKEVRAAFRQQKG